MEVLVDGQSVGSSPLVAQEGYEEASLWDRAWYAVEGLAERAWAWLGERLNERLFGLITLQFDSQGAHLFRVPSALCAILQGIPPTLIWQNLEKPRLQGRSLHPSFVTGIVGGTLGKT